MSLMMFGPTEIGLRSRASIGVVEWSAVARPCCMAIGLVASILMGCTQQSGAQAMQADEQAGAIQPPMLVRFVSNAPGTGDQVCFGAVTKAQEGFPTEVQIVKSAGRPLCERPKSRVEAVAQLNAALTALDDPSARHGPAQAIAPNDMADRILAPVSVLDSWLDESASAEDKLFIVGAGINYRDHAEEVAVAEPILFPKPVVPTGPYGTLDQVSRLGGKGGSVCLLDYEVEIAFVVLEDLDLQALPTRGALWDKLAFFAVNDVSDREPIILDQKLGFTRAKARPGFMPSGPWLVAGRHLVPRTYEGGTEALLLSLSTREASKALSPWVQRQRASSSDMILGPQAILASLKDRVPTGDSCQAASAVCSMKDDRDVDRYMLRNSVLPAGSIILTGTPGGTAIKDPGVLIKMQYFLRARFDFKKAYELAVQDQIRDRAELGYLEPGDEVDQTVGYLGRQKWQISEDPPTGGCVADAKSS